MSSKNPRKKFTNKGKSPKLKDGMKKLYESMSKAGASNDNGTVYLGDGVYLRPDGSMTDGPNSKP